MNTKVVTITVIVLVALAGGAAVMLGNKSQPEHAKHNDSSKNHSDQMQPANNSASESSSAEVKETNQVTFKNFDVVEKVVRVKKGTTVTWTNEDTAKHDVTPDKETDEFKASPLFGKGETYQVTFNTPGTYTYYCSPHPYMKGTIEVVE